MASGVVGNVGRPSVCSEQNGLSVGRKRGWDCGDEALLEVSDSPRVRNIVGLPGHAQERCVRGHYFYECLVSHPLMGYSEASV